MFFGSFQMSTPITNMPSHMETTPNAVEMNDTESVPSANESTQSASGVFPWTMTS